MLKGMKTQREKQLEEEFKKIEKEVQFNISHILPEGYTDATYLTIEQILHVIKLDLMTYAIHEIDGEIHIEVKRKQEMLVD